jgi:hypothetical protein
MYKSARCPNLSCVEPTGAVGPVRIKRRTAAAFLFALGIALTGTLTFTADIRTVFAFNDESAASFFRNDRARNQPQRAAPQAAPALPSIFGARSLTVTVPVGGASQGTMARPLNAGSDKPKKERRVAATGTPGDRLSDEGISSGGARSVCVRLCDGYHFPVGNTPSTSDVVAHEAVCSATCPGAPTRLFFMPAGTDDIGRAYSARGGQSYSALPVALRHADKHDKTCSCRRNNEPQMALVSLYRDFTLRSGDAVMTQKGFQVFRGARKYPYNPRDFAHLGASSLGKAEIRMLQAMERASVAGGNSPRERPQMTPRTTSSPVPVLGPFAVKRPNQRAEIEGSTPARTAGTSLPTLQ